MTPPATSHEPWPPAQLTSSDVICLVCIVMVMAGGGSFIRSQKETSSNHLAQRPCVFPMTPDSWVPDSMLRTPRGAAWTWAWHTYTYYSRLLFSSSRS
jgi:hypothetical protein